MPRLFTGIELPDALKGRLCQMQQGVAGARWQSTEQMHLTLNFIGNVDGAWLNDICEAATAVTVAPFEIALAGTGSFGKPGQSQTLWAGVTPAESLIALHLAIDERLRAKGLVPDARAYRPHVTLARLRNPGRSSADFLGRHAELASAPFAVTSISLFESTLGEDGAHYRVLERFPLSRP